MKTLLLALLLFTGCGQLPSGPLAFKTAQPLYPYVLDAAIQLQTIYPYTIAVFGPGSEPPEENWNPLTQEPDWEVWTVELVTWDSYRGAVLHCNADQAEGSLGVCDPDRHRIIIADCTARERAVSVAHEMGHVFTDQHWDDAAVMRESFSPKYSSSTFNATELKRLGDLYE